MERRRILKIAKEDGFYDGRKSIIGKVMQIERIDRNHLMKGPYVSARGIVEGRTWCGENMHMMFYMILLSKPLTNEEDNGTTTNTTTCKG